MKILLDCNILMDVASRRMPFFTDSSGVLDWCEQHPGSAVTAWHSFATLYYLTVKTSGDAAVRQFIRDYLIFGEVVETGTPEMRHALHLSIPDLEDGMQAAAAVRAGADFIITRNLRDFANSPVPAISPANFLAIAPP